MEKNMLTMFVSLHVTPFAKYSILLFPPPPTTPSALLCLHCGRLLNNLLTAMGLVCNLILPLIVCFFYKKFCLDFALQFFILESVVLLMCSQISPLNVSLFLLFPIVSAFFVFDRSLPTMQNPR